MAIFYSNPEAGSCSLSVRADSRGGARQKDLPEVGPSTRVFTVTGQVSRVKRCTDGWMGTCESRNPVGVSTGVQAVVYPLYRPVGCSILFLIRAHLTPGSKGSNLRFDRFPPELKEKLTIFSLRGDLEYRRRVVSEDSNCTKMGFGVCLQTKSE